MASVSTRLFRARAWQRRQCRFRRCDCAFIIDTPALRILHSIEFQMRDVEASSQAALVSIRLQHLERARFGDIYDLARDSLVSTLFWKPVSASSSARTESRMQIGPTIRSLCQPVWTAVPAAAAQMRALALALALAIAVSRWMLAQIGAPALIRCAWPGSMLNGCLMDAMMLQERGAGHPGC